jgi:hypothetical protein
LLIQPCDQKLCDDNRTEVLPPGTDLRLKLGQVKLGQVSLSAEAADIALKRTLFWLPRSPDVALDPAEPALTADSLSSDGPWFRADETTKLAAFIRRRLGNSALVLRAEAGIDDHIERDLRRGLEPVFQSTFLFETVKRENIAASIGLTAAEKRPIVVALHDWKVEETDPDPRNTIHFKARETDVDIQRVLRSNGGDNGLRIARAIFLFRHGDIFDKMEHITFEGTWVLVPLDTRKEDYAPPRERLERIRDALRAG